MELCRRVGWSCEVGGGVVREGGDGVIGQVLRERKGCKW